GGYVGLEVAESFCKLGKHVTLINRGQYVGKIFDEDMATYIHEEAKKHSIHFVFEENTEKFAGTVRATHVITDQTEHETDLVIVSIGVHPNTEFLHSIQKTKKGAIIVNERMETNIRDVYAAGDCATQFHRVKKADDYIPLGTNANKIIRFFHTMELSRTVSRSINITNICFHPFIDDDSTFFCFLNRMKKFRVRMNPYRYDD